MNIKSPLPGNDVGYKKEGSSVHIFCAHAVVGVFECVARENVQMKVWETKARVCRIIHLSTFWRTHLHWRTRDR